MGRPKRYERFQAQPGKPIRIAGQPRVLKYTRAEKWLAWILGLLLLAYMAVSYQHRVSALGPSPKPPLTPVSASPAGSKP